MFRVTLPVRKISCCNRFSRFLSLYWKSLIVVITPLALLPIILLNDIPVSHNLVVNGEKIVVHCNDNFD